MCIVHLFNYLAVCTVKLAGNIGHVARRFMPDFLGYSLQCPTMYKSIAFG